MREKDEENKWTMTGDKPCEAMRHKADKQRARAAEGNEQEAK